MALWIAASSWTVGFDCISSHFHDLRRIFCARDEVRVTRVLEASFVSLECGGRGAAKFAPKV